MSDRAAAFRATYSDLKLIKGRKVVQFVFEVPIEESNKAYEVLGGMPNPAVSMWCAIARLESSAREVSSQKPPPTTAPIHPPAGAHDTPAQRSALLCKNELFHRYLEWLLDRNLKTVDEEFATIYLREWCNVESRAQILPGTASANLLGDLFDEFYRWKYVPKVENA